MVQNLVRAHGLHHVLAGVCLVKPLGFSQHSTLMFQSNHFPRVSSVNTIARLSCHHLNSMNVRHWGSNSYMSLQGEIITAYSQEIKPRLYLDYYF